MNYSVKDSNTTANLGQLPKENFDDEYLRLIQADLADAQANLDNLPELQRRGLTMDTLKHFHCGYLQNWILTKSRAEFSCGLYIDKLTGEPKQLPPPSPRIIIPTAGGKHFNAAATPSARLKTKKRYWKQHAGTKELFCDPDALNAELIVVVEGEFDAMSIWQASQGKISAVAILGCENWKKTLLPRLNELKGKKFLILFDADDAGKKSSKTLREELIGRGYPAVSKTFFDDALPQVDKNEFGLKVDANDILKQKGDAYLNALLERIIKNVDFAPVQAQIAELQKNPFGEGSEPDIAVNPSNRDLTHEPARTLDFSDFKPTDTDRDKISLIIKDFVHAKGLSRDEWFSVGCVMKRYGFSLEDFQIWSNDGDKRYSAADCVSQWNSIKPADELNGKGYTIATLIELAKNYGFEPSKKIQVRADFNGYDFMQGTVEDLDNARRLEKYRGNQFRWLTDDELWLTFDNGIWTRRSEKNSCLYPFATQFADDIMNFANFLAEKAQVAAKAATTTNANGSIQSIDEQAKLKVEKAEEERKKAFSIAYYFQKRKNYSAAIDLLKGCESILISADDLNRHKNLFCVKNGVVDLQTGKLYPLDAKYLITNQADVFFTPKADTAFVEKFFHEVIPDESTLLGVLRYLGYCLTGEKNYHICQFWRGTGANGKSTILDMLIKLLGFYAIKLPTNSMVESPRPLDANAASPALAMLDGDIRLAILDEIPRNCRLDATTFKTITGDQFITARPLYGNPRKIELRAKLILNGNHLPNFDVDDGGLQRRINNVEYTQIFSGSRMDVTLPEKLAVQENRSAFLNILVNQAISFYRDGLFESDAMKDAKAEYFTENNFVASFVDEYCIVGTGGTIKRKDFEERLKDTYRAETSRLKKKELFRIITEHFNSLNVTYAKDREKNNVFEDIQWRMD